MANPYQTPQQGFGKPQFGSDGAAKEKVKTPAMVLLVLTAIMMVLSVLFSILNFMGLGFAAMNPGGGMGGGQGQQMELMFSGVAGLIGLAVSLAVGGVIIVGCQKMMKLESYGWSMAACILSMIPCLAPCCLVGLPVGIWGLVVLNDPAVKSAFRA
jgi:hypothetical protein